MNPGGTQITVVHGVEPAAAAAWDALAGPADLHLSASWLATAEAMSPQRARYLLARRADGEPIAVLPTYLLDQAASSPFVRPDLVLARLMEEHDRAPGRDHEPGGGLSIDPEDLLPALYCGSRQVGDSRPLMNSQDPGLMTALVGAAREVGARQGAASTVFMYVDEHRSALRRCLQDAGFMSFHSGWRTELPVVWSDFAGYLASLSAGRRQQVRRERRRLEAAEVDISCAPLRPADSTELARVEAGLLAARGNVQPSDRLARMLFALADGLAGQVVVFRAHRAGALLGFAVFVRRGDRLYLANVGVDHALRGNLPVYFGLLFYAVVPYAIEQGVRSVDYGVGATEAKTSRGCRATAQLGYIHCADPLVGARLAPALRRLRTAPVPAAPGTAG